MKLQEAKSQQIKTAKPRRRKPSRRAFVVIAIPAANGEYDFVDAQVFWLMVGETRRKFFIHQDKLRDYRTGVLIAALSHARFAGYCQRRKWHRSKRDIRITDRQAAQDTIDLFVLNFGAARVLEELESRPTLNAD